MARTLKLILVALLAISISAVSASAALAVFAPHYHVNEKFLKEKEFDEIEGANNGNQVFKEASFTIACETHVFHANSKILGGEPGTSEEIIEFSNCSITGNGAKCVITSVAGAKNEKIVTNNLKNEGVYLKFAAGAEKKGTPIGFLFKPITGTVLATVKFEPATGGTCTVAETKIEGSVAGESLSEKKVVAYGENEKEAEVNEITFPGKTITTVWGVAKEELDAEAGNKVELKAFGLKATFEGKLNLKLKSKEEWGVFAKE
jgi:hypothetical protein